MRLGDDPAWVEEYLSEGGPHIRAAYEDTLRATGDKDAAWEAVYRAEKAARVAEFGHDCEDHVEWSAVEAPCPACPGGIWRAQDAFCGVCGDLLQAAGHVHGPWLARTQKALRDGVPPEDLGLPLG
jgi:hypothetical protein